jgi:hypothetical protein
MNLVKRFGGVTAVVLTTARKAMTLVLSFVLFPKGFSWLYVHGSVLVLGAVMMASICKMIGSKKAPLSSSSSLSSSSEDYVKGECNSHNDEESSRLLKEFGGIFLLDDLEKSIQQQTPNQQFAR